MKGVFTLIRKWPIARPLNVRFELSKRGKESTEEAASRFMDIILAEIPKLREYLYD